MPELTPTASDRMNVVSFIFLFAVAVCRKTKVRFSITVRLHQSLRNIIEAIPEEDWTPIPYWMEGAADVAETSYTPFDSEPLPPTPRRCGSSYAG